MTGGFFDFKRVRRRLRSPVTTGAGAVDSVDRIILRTQSDQGTGYGEIAPWPGFQTENCDQIVEALRSAQGSLSRLQATVAASRSSLPCLSAALSSCQHWNEIESFTGSLPCAGLLTAPTAEGIAEKATQGYHTIKLKILAETDSQQLQDLLGQCSPTLRFRLDANGSLNLELARAWAAVVRSLPNVEFLEQPLPPGHPGYASLGPEKIALDESFLTPQGIEWPGPVVVKPCLAGDWDEVLRWRRARSGPVIYSSSFETAIGRQAALWLAAQDSHTGAIGFDTLGRFEMDGRDRHEAGPVARGLLNVRWQELWKQMA